MYQRLTKVLSELGLVDPHVEKTLVTHIGCTRFARIEEPSMDSRFPVTDLEGSLDKEAKEPLHPEELQSAILRALQKHPNIFDIAAPDKQQPIFLMPQDYCMFIGGATFSLKVSLPARLQKYHNRYFASAEAPIEQFQVVSSGSLFSAFAPIQDYGVWTHIGHEYREIIKTSMHNETNFNCPSFGPSPLHPNIYIVFINNLDDALQSTNRILTYDDDIMFVVDSKHTDDLQLVTAVFKSIEFPLLSFYALQSHRDVLIDYHTEIFNHFADLSTSIKDLLETPIWQIIKSARLARTGKSSLRNVHTRLVEFEENLSGFNRRRLPLLNDIKEDRLLSKLLSYFEEHTDIDTTIPPTFIAAVGHFEGELRAFENLRTIIISSLVGAAVGALLIAFLA